MNVTSFVARPGLSEVDAEFCSARGDGGFVEVNEGPINSYAGIGSFFNGGRHPLHEAFAAIRIDRVIT
jgi:hypothetical protein